MGWGHSSPEHLGQSFLSMDKALGFTYKTGAVAHKDQKFMGILIYLAIEANLDYMRSYLTKQTNSPSVSISLLLRAPPKE